MKLTVLFENVGHSLCQNLLAFMTKIGEWFGFGRHGQLLAKATLAYAQLTRSLRGPYADVRAQLRKNQSCQVRIHHTSDTPKNLIKKTIQSELTPPLRQQCWQKMLTQAYAHQRFAYAKGPYKDPKTKHKHRGLKRGSCGNH